MTETGRPVSDPDEEFTGAEIRDLTARATAAHSGAGAGEALTDIAAAVLSVVITAGLIAGLVNALRLEFAPVPGEGTVDPGLLQVLALAALLAGALGLAVRTGPLGISRAGVQWWLPMPVDREGLLTPSWWRAVVGWPAVVGAVAVAAGAVVGVAGSQVVAGAVCAAAAGLLAVAGAGLVQPSSRRAAALTTTADILVAAVPAVGVVLVWVGVGVPGWVGWPLAVACAVVGGPLVLRWRRTLDDLPAAALRARAGTTERAQGALYSLDTRELARSVAGPVSTMRPARVRRFTRVRGPVSALVAADATLVSRSPATVAQLVGLACLLLLGLQVPVLSAGPGLFLLLVVAGFRAGQLGAAGARVAEMAPVLDALLPMSARRARAARCVLPVACAVLVLVVGTLPLAAAWGVAWSAMIAVAGAVLGMAAIRSAYRPPPNWSAPLLATPAGAVPTGATTALVRGPDAALLGCVPLGVVLVVGQAPWMAVLVQMSVAAIVLLVATRVPRAR